MNGNVKIRKEFFQKVKNKKVLIIGAGNAGEKILRGIFENDQLHYSVIGFIDDDPEKRGRSIHGISVLGSLDEITSIMEKEEVEEDAEAARIRQMLRTNLDDLELSVRSHNCLRAAEIHTIADLVRREEAELLKFRNFGRKSLAELSAIVEEKGLTFGMDVDKYLKDSD